MIDTPRMVLLKGIVLTSAMEVSTQNGLNDKLDA